MLNLRRGRPFVGARWGRVSPDKVAVPFELGAMLGPAGSGPVPDSVGVG
jgi:hypothetical protein